MKKRMKGDEEVKLNVTFGKGVAEGWRDERRGRGNSWCVCVCVRVFVVGSLT